MTFHSSNRDHLRPTSLTVNASAQVQLTNVVEYISLTDNRYFSISVEGSLYVSNYAHLLSVLNIVITLCEKIHIRHTVTMPFISITMQYSDISPLKLNLPGHFYRIQATNRCRNFALWWTKMAKYIDFVDKLKNIINN